MDLDVHRRAAASDRSPRRAWYQAIVRRSASSSSNSGRQPSTRSAFAALTASIAGASVPTPAAGIGGAVAGLVQARESWLQARIAARVAASRNAAAPLVLEWPELGVHRLLGAGTDAALREAVLTSGVAALLAEGGPELVRTAKSYLDSAGSAQRTAQALGIHRQTLYHRLERIERISGLSLDSGQDRLQLHLALALLPGLDQ